MNDCSPTVQLDALEGAYSGGFRYHQEDVAMLSWYAERIGRQLRSAECHSLLSLGVGFQIVCRRLCLELERSLRHYVVLEGSQALVHRVREMLRHHGLELVHTLFEEFETDERFDAIEMGFVLEHVAAPAALLEHYVRLLEPDGRMFVAVPNARSLHRRVGQAALVGAAVSRRVAGVPRVAGPWIEAGNRERQPRSLATAEAGCDWLGPML